jgi:hypothetical protein
MNLAVSSFFYGMWTGAIFRLIPVKQFHCMEQTETPWTLIHDTQTEATVKTSCDNNKTIWETVAIGKLVASRECTTSPCWHQAEIIDHFSPIRQCGMDASNPENQSSTTRKPLNMQRVGFVKFHSQMTLLAGCLALATFDWKSHLW